MRLLVPILLTALVPVAGKAAPIVAATRIAAGGHVAVELIVTNPSSVATAIPGAPRIAATLSGADGSSRSIDLIRADDQAGRIALPPSGFATVRYGFDLPTGAATTWTLALPDAPAVALAPDAAAPRLASVEPHPSSPPVPAPLPPSAPDRSAAEERGRSGFLANLSTYEPIYAVFGSGTNTNARLQVSLQYQFFGTPGVAGSWLDGIRFGYTQRMFWDLRARSAPFRDVNYMPELFYALPTVATFGGWQVSGRFGARHESNGRSGTASRSVNTLYVEPEVTTTLGDYAVAFGPRAWIYAGRRSDNPDIRRYRGNAGLFARIGTADGLQLDVTGRLNPASGKGAAEGLVSYPLTGLWSSGPKLYLFGQAFAGYGESLLDYNRRQTRARIGLGFTR